MHRLELEFSNKVKQPLYHTVAWNIDSIGCNTERKAKKSYEYAATLPRLKASNKIKSPSFYIPSRPAGLGKSESTRTGAPLLLDMIELTLFGIPYTPETAETAFSGAPLF